jgi:ATP-dependent DNA helicase RecQ
VIFHDRTLLELSSLMPRNSDEMSGIYGVGTVKIARYGDIFLEVIAAYCRANKVPPTRG